MWGCLIWTAPPHVWYFRTILAIYSCVKTNRRGFLQRTSKLFAYLLTLYELTSGRINQLIVSLQHSLGAQLPSSGFQWEVILVSSSPSHLFFSPAVAWTRHLGTIHAAVPEFLAQCFLFNSIMRSKFLWVKIFGKCLQMEVAAKIKTLKSHFNEGPHAHRLFLGELD